MRMMTENFVFSKEDEHFSGLLKQETVYGPNMHSLYFIYTFSFHSHSIGNSLGLLELWGDRLGRFIRVSYVCRKVQKNWQDLGLCISYLIYGLVLLLSDFQTSPAAECF